MAEVARRVLQVGATFGSQVVSEAVRPYAGEAGRRVPVRTILPARSRGGLARTSSRPGHVFQAPRSRSMIASSRVTSGDSSRRSSAARAVLLDVGAGPKGADGLSQAVFRNRGRPV